MYVSTTAPYLFMLVLLIRGATLPGAADGIKYYLYPDIQKLKNLRVGTERFYLQTVHFLINCMTTAKVITRSKEYIKKWPLHSFFTVVSFHNMEGWPLAIKGDPGFEIIHNLN